MWGSGATTFLMMALPYFQKVLNANGTVSPTQFLAGNPTLLADIGQISGTGSVGNQDYDALQMTWKKQLSDGLTFSGSYTWSKCLTNSIGYYGQSGQAAKRPTGKTFYNAAAEWGACDYDATHNVVVKAVYALPFGRGQKFASQVNRAVDAVLGGWQASGILSLHTGFPLTITASDSPAPYAQPATGTFGNCGVGTIRGPGLKTLDFNLAKNFTITEKQHLELRGEFINLMNTPILNAPTRSIGTTLGLLQPSQGSRNVQIALKYRF
jgi:hypothetical protein